MHGIVVILYTVLRNTKKTLIIWTKTSVIRNVYEFTPKIRTENGESSPVDDQIY